ncbi:hypothetical protein CANTEDRAFT_130460 [Yamadazyma tenuis ATCC 10573]|uniref:Mitochondrial group I intron splicing factor CCM1 n=1 Tax=Candida tenuis (strain ATCC 10573 / BCRC 21748 / CBS 615 / JCM 9827 / NBRC 10315 / NRRL Y-1498 / VKM Y-70) TaxID=590646 RepID=G3B3C2_CANTC|nr:uncharacterized protein CANTEDRAFT_130460 [Yamadazyma tenuis ATCC 10573]EGV64135.1 hypothetical protein CANTEDRAFT_130460 [Yamadazyma tenuis ATCC 10573]
MASRHPWMAVATRLQSTVNAGAAGNPAPTPISPDPSANSPQTGRKRPPTHRKLFEIRNQQESVEIFEEAISYLREVQVADVIPSFDIYISFQKLGVTLLRNLIEGKASSEEVDNVLQVLIEHRVVHAIHFCQVMKYNLELADYTRNLRCWVSYLETKNSFGSDSALIDKPFQNVRYDFPSFSYSLVRDLTYYSYFLGSKTDYKFSFEDVKNVLQADNLAPAWRVHDNLEKFLGPSSQLDDFKTSVGRLYYQSVSSDPNSSESLKRMDAYAAKRDGRGLVQFYDSLKGQNLDYKTVHKLMISFYEVGRFDMVYEMFNGLIKKDLKLTKPVWDVMIKSMGHADNTRGLTQESKDELAVNVEKLINTMVEQGFDVDARVLASIVASFSNLNRFDKVDEYLETYSSVPVIHVTKSSYLMGLILNDRVEEAEKKLKQFMGEDSTYAPSASSMNALLDHYSKQNNLDAVNGIIKFMGDHDIAENVVSLTIVADLYFRVTRKRGLVPNVEEMFSLFKKTNTNINMHTYAVIMDGLIKNYNLQAARDIFEWLKKGNHLKKQNSVNIMTIMIKGELDFGDVDRAESLFDEYLKGFANDTQAWNMMIVSILDKNEKAGWNYYLRLQKQKVNNVRPNFYTFYFLFRHFVRKNNRAIIEQLIADLDRAELTSLGKDLPRILRELSTDYVIPTGLKQRL